MVRRDFSPVFVGIVSEVWFSVDFMVWSFFQFEDLRDSSPKMEASAFDLMLGL